MIIPLPLFTFFSAMLFSAGSFHFTDIVFMHPPPSNISFHAVIYYTIYTCMHFIICSGLIPLNPEWIRNFDMKCFITELILSIVFLLHYELELYWAGESNFFEYFIPLLAIAIVLFVKKETLEVIRHLHERKKFM